MAKSAATLVAPMSQTTKREAAILELLRDICAAGIVLSSLVPEASSRYVFVPLVVLWIIFALLSSPKAFHKAFLDPDIKSYSVYLWLLTYIIFYLIGYMQSAEIGVLLNYMRIGFSLILFNYYLEAGNVMAIKRLIAFALLCIFVTCITTLRGLALDPMAARVLATGREELMQGLAGLAIGSYGFIYGLVFVAIATVGLIRSNLLKKQKILFAAMAALFIYTIYSSAFMMALLILTTVLILLFLNIKKTRWLLASALITMIALVALSPFFYSVLSFFGGTVENEVLSMRFNELAHAIKHGGVEGTANLADRWYFLTLSVASFLTNPILGVGGSYGFGTSAYGIGGHSAFFDELAKYGILGSGALFVALVSNASFVYRRLEHSKQKMVYYCSMVAFFILGTINTLLFVPVIFAAYFVVPGMIWAFSRTDLPTRTGTHEYPLVRKYSASRYSKSRRYST